MKFTKMQGCGNDFIIVDCREESVTDPAAAAKKLCDHHFGIGADGLLLLKPSDKAAFRMESLNPDGSEGRMNGNGIRCLAKYAYTHGITDQTELEIDTFSGLHHVRLIKGEDGSILEEEVDMGEPVLNTPQIPAVFPKNQIIDEPIWVHDIGFRITCLSMGNPHAVTFVRNLDQIRLHQIGPLFESNLMFPDRVSVEFVQVEDRNRLLVRVWERGAGESLSCGTGACACAVAGVLNGITEEKVQVELPGGILKVFYDKGNNRVFLTGEAEEVYRGVIEL